MSLPSSTRRLFPDRVGAPVPSETIGRLLEEGDTSDLRWLVERYGEAELAAWLERFGGRLLSRRSRSFWREVLGTSTSDPSPLTTEIWPL